MTSSLPSGNCKQLLPLSLPAILDGKDVIAQGKTGSGKTPAFTLDLLEKLEVSD